MSAGVNTLLTLTIAIGGAATVSRVDASPGDGVGQGSSSSGVITAGATVYTNGGAATSSGSSSCTWDQIQTLGSAETAQVSWPNTRNGITYELWRKTCNGVETYIEVPQTKPTDLLPGLLSQLKSSKLPEPTPTFLGTDPQFGWAYVQVPLDFRANPASWAPVSVTASAGPVWATVTATPQRLTFDPGDPSGPGAVSCDGEGPIAAYVADAPGACSYTYVDASSTSPVDGYHFTTEMTIEWAIVWTSSTGAGGALPAFSTTSTTPLAVAEAKGLVTCTGGRPQEGGC
ncbi:MAG: uncharacterized protein JWM34_3737 [Ilumatobacteraceae bacterium]|nr:uncharacterized protein [Ilumatobacteraceae bacterium]